MTQRLDAFQAAPAAIDALLQLSKASAESELEHDMLELVKIRASQINGCAYSRRPDCRDLHHSQSR